MKDNLKKIILTTCLWIFSIPTLFLIGGMGRGWETFFIPIAAIIVVTANISLTLKIKKLQKNFAKFSLFMGCLLFSLLIFSLFITCTTDGPSCREFASSGLSFLGFLFYFVFFIILLKIAPKKELAKTGIRLIKLGVILGILGVMTSTVLRMILFGLLPSRFFSLPLWLSPLGIIIFIIGVIIESKKT